MGPAARGVGACITSRFGNEISPSGTMIHDLDVVELACGTAYFSGWLTRAGATTAAVDLSGEQLATARRMSGQLGPVFPLVQGDAERVRWREDVSTSWYASTEPLRGETPSAGCQRRPGSCGRGVLVFLTNSHLSALCVPAEEGVGGKRLVSGHCEAYQVRWPGGGIEFHPSHGDGLRLLCRSGAVVEAMQEAFTPSMVLTIRSPKSCWPRGRPSGRPSSCGWRCVREQGRRRLGLPSRCLARLSAPPATSAMSMCLGEQAVPRLAIPMRRWTLCLAGALVRTADCSAFGDHRSSADEGESLIHGCRDSVQPRVHRRTPISFVPAAAVQVHHQGLRLGRGGFRSEHVQQQLLAVGGAIDEPAFVD